MGVIVKARITMTVTVEYEINPTSYPKGATPEEMLAIDIANAEDDPYIFLEMPESKLVVKGEILERP